MKLSTEQSEALAKISRWEKGDGRQPFVLAGFAGTGKTTLLQHYVNLQDDPVVCLAPTGKAASVLAKKLNNARVSTIHSALYKPISPSTDRLDALEYQLTLHPDDPDIQQAIVDERERLSKKDVSFTMRDTELQPGQLVVVDEASMVTQEMRRDLAKTCARIIYVGDPGQLPPVKERGFFEDIQPDASLINIQRQALDSHIIQLSLDIRKGKEIPEEFDRPGVRRARKQSVELEEWLKYDQVITGSNASRQRINRFYRTKANRLRWWPDDGEKLICLKNRTHEGVSMVNGGLAKTLRNFEYNLEFEALYGTVLYDGAVVEGAFYEYPFQSHYDNSAKDLPYQMRSTLLEFDFAYAITVHKSQGSEWDSVILADDKMQEGQREFRKRWLYTAVTRAKETLLWIS